MLKLNYKKWKNIPGYKNYMISENGDVYSLPRKKILAQAFNWAGYKVVTVTDDHGFRAPRKVHRLVYLAFVGKLDPSKVIDHKDDKKLNNHYTNLQQITSSENSVKSFITGKNKDKVVWSKEFIEEICKLIVKNLSEKEIFETLGIDYESNKKQCNILLGKLRRNEIHSDITSKYDLSNYITSINKKDVKLSVNQVKVLYIRLLFDDVSVAELTRLYGITYSTACKIRDKKTWRLVQLRSLKNLE